MSVLTFGYTTAQPPSGLQIGSKYILSQEPLLTNQITFLLVSKVHAPVAEGVRNRKSRRSLKPSSQTACHPVLESRAVPHDTQVVLCSTPAFSQTAILNRMALVQGTHRSR